MGQQPNILFILADDLGWADVSMHGSPILTPNIDRLAAGGVELRRHYVCPTCTPTRASLMTGRYAGRFGVHATAPTNDAVLPDGCPTIAGAFRAGGYSTGLFGKWHLGSSSGCIPNRYGFDASYGSLAGGVDPYSHRYKRGAHSITWHRDGTLIEEDGHATDLITREAIGWISECQGPWFCYVPFTAVHIPVNAPHEWLDRYAYCDFDSDPERDQSFKRYAAYTSHMDDAVGKLVDFLTAKRLLEDTLVVFASDNGATEGYSDGKLALYPGFQEHHRRLGSNLPFRGQKGQLYEGGIRTPCVVSWKGTVPVGHCDSAVHVCDWLPTLAKAADLDASMERVDGTTVWDAITHPHDHREVTGWNETPVDRPLYWNVKEQRFSLISDRWKLMTNRDSTSGQDCELYDLQADPYEQANVAETEGTVVARLLEQLRSVRALDNSARRADAPDAPAEL